MTNEPRLIPLALSADAEVRYCEACYRDHPIGASPERFTEFVVAIRSKGILVPEMLPFEDHGGAASN